MKGEYYLDEMYVSFNGKDFIRTDTNEVIDGHITTCYNNAVHLVIYKDDKPLEVVRPRYKITPRKI